MMKLTGGVPLRKGWELLATQPMQADGEVVVRTGNTVTLVDVIGEPCDVRCFDRRVCAWMEQLCREPPPEGDPAYKQGCWLTWARSGRRRQRAKRRPRKRDERRRRQREQWTLLVPAMKFRPSRLKLPPSKMNFLVTTRDASSQCHGLPRALGSVLPTSPCRSGSP